MNSLRKLLIISLFGMPAMALAMNDAEAPSDPVAEERADGREIVDCSDYRGALRRVGDGKCLRPMGVRKVYTRADLEGTGEFGNAEALKRLDPTIQ